MFLNLTLLLFFLILLIVAISKWRIHPFIALIFIALAMGVSMGMGGEKTVEVLLKGFSETLRWIAIIIILGAFIGEVLQGLEALLEYQARLLNGEVKRDCLGPWDLQDT